MIPRVVAIVVALAALGTGRAGYAQRTGCAVRGRSVYLADVRVTPPGAQDLALVVSGLPARVFPSDDPALARIEVERPVAFEGVARGDSVAYAFAQAYEALGGTVRA